MKTFKSIIKILFSLIILVWVGVIVYDLLLFKDNKQMKFCLNEETKNVNGGTTYICTGLGYKAYRYDWPNTSQGHYQASDFVPFFINERTSIWLKK